MATAHLTYHYEPEGWWADSPEFPGYSAVAGSLGEVRLLAHEGLRLFADDETLNVLDEFSMRPSGTTAIAPEEVVTSCFGLVRRRHSGRVGYSEAPPVAI